ncbi:MAG: glutamate 5-kinase [Treponema sp.]|nr:glutamate 5-kinase [Treponema sp.]
MFKIYSMTIHELFSNARKIVFKFGSNTLAADNGRINVGFLEEFADQAAAFIKKGKKIIIVSSGAQAAGLSTLGKWERKKDIHYRQALCAVGQVQLMDAWRKAFLPHNCFIAQILLTREDFCDPIRTLNMRNTLFTLVDEGIIPIINENDTVSVEEIKIGENDTLAAQSAILWSADLLVLFSDIDGLYYKNPKEFSDQKLLETVTDIKTIKENIETGATSSFGTGGIATKLEAAQHALSYGIPTVLANGKTPRCLEALAEGRQKGTVFLG